MDNWHNIPQLYMIIDDTCCCSLLFVLVVGWSKKMSEDHDCSLRFRSLLVFWYNLKSLLSASLPRSPNIKVATLFIMSKRWVNVSIFLRYSTTSVINITYITHPASSSSRIFIRIHRFNIFQLPSPQHRPCHEWGRLQSSKNRNYSLDATPDTSPFLAIQTLIFGCFWIANDSQNQFFPRYPQHKSTRRRFDVSACSPRSPASSVTLAPIVVLRGWERPQRFDMFQGAETNVTHFIHILIFFHRIMYLYLSAIRSCWMKKNGWEHHGKWGGSMEKQREVMENELEESWTMRNAMERDEQE